MPVTACPNRELLARYLLGHLRDEEFEHIASHVESCQACQTHLDRLDGAADSLVNALRQTGPPPLDGDDSELEELVSRVEALGRESPRDQSDKGGSPKASSDRPRPRQLGQYQLLERLGRGGMGVVYKARHARLKRLVAVKVIAHHRLPDPQAVARFYREMEAVGRLSHQNIVQAHDAGEADGHHFLAMEFVDGRNLSQLVRSGGPFPVADACEIVRQAALGLEHAHRHGLVHRDVKPSNLMLTKEGTVKLLDLGLARLIDGATADDEATGSQQILGSPDFMAPEQANDSRLVDARTDLYSLGCTLYFLLTGKPPFAGPQYDTRLKKVLGHAQAQPTPVLSMRSDLPASVAPLLGRLMAKRPDDRPRSAAEVAQAMASLAVGADLAGLVRRCPEPTTAEKSGPEDDPFDAVVRPARQSWLERELIVLRRNWLVVGLAVVVLMLVGWLSLPRQPAVGVPPPPTVVHEYIPPSMPADALDGMMESFHKANDGLGETMRNLGHAQAQEAEERRRRDAEFQKSNAGRARPEN